MSIMPKTNAPPLEFRQTGPNTFMVDAGDTYIGTVQKFTSHEWWAFPASTIGSPAPITRSTREDAASALLAHAASTATPDGRPVPSERQRNWGTPGAYVEGS